MPAPDEALRLVRDAAKRAYDGGFAAHPGLVLGFDGFFGRIQEWTMCGEAAAVVARIESMEAADYYLASACELGCAGAWDRLTQIYQPRFRAMALRWGASASDAEEIARELPGELLGKPANSRFKASTAPSIRRSISVKSASAIVPLLTPITGRL